MVIGKKQALVALVLACLVVFVFSFFFWFKKEVEKEARIDAVYKELRDANAMPAASDEIMPGGSFYLSPEEVIEKKRLAAAGDADAMLDLAGFYGFSQGLASQQHE